MMGSITDKISIYELARALGVDSVTRVDAFDLAAGEKAAKEAAAQSGVRVLLFEGPCIAVSKPKPAYRVDEERCIGCKRCISQLGCPSMVMRDGKAFIDETTCYGCSICAQVCSVSAIGEGGEKHD